MLTGPVTGKEFFDRKALLASLKKDVPHAHHALIGPRGCGKSSILQQLATAEKVDKLAPVYLNIAHIVPRTHQSVVKKLGREVLRAVVKEKGLLPSMPALVKDGAGRVVDFVRDNFRVKIGEWATLYFDADPDLTDLLRETFNAIESYGVELLVMLDEISSLVRLTGPQPRGEDMEFMEALREHISGARNAHYILSGSHLGVMRLIVTMKFGRHLTPKSVEGFEEDGADDFIRAKLGQKISGEFAEEIKARTRLWPLYLRAYCHAAELIPTKPKHAEELEEEVFRILHGHLSYLEGQLGEKEIMVLCAMDEKTVSKIASALETTYGTIISILRILELKGFVKKISPSMYEFVDPVFSAWLKKTYERPDEWR